MMNYPTRRRKSTKIPSRMNKEIVGLDMNAAKEAFCRNPRSQISVCGRESDA